jgi:uncharacterized protein YndB with AHSA1/START domain
MKEIYQCFWIRSPLQKVYNALTEESGIAGWWTKDLAVSKQIGGVSTFRFKSGAFNKMKIINIAPNKVEWVCIDGHKEWIGTRITFEMRQDNGGTKLCFSHFGWKEQTEYTGECSFHWAYHFNNLINFCETGEGMPSESK